MNSKDEARLSMYQSVLAFLKKHPEITATLPNYPERIADIELAIEKLLKLGKELNSDRSGIADTKKEQAAEIELKVADLSGKMVAYATVKKDNELLKLVKINITTLRKSRDNDLVSHSLKLCDAAEALLPAVTTFMVTQADITHIRTLCAAFLVNMPKPKESVKDKSEVLLAIKKLMKETDASFLEMDAIMLIVRYSKPEFYAHYSSSRVVVNTGARKLAVQCKFTDAVTGLGLKGVQAVFELVTDAEMKSASGAELVKNVKKSSAKGGLNIKTMAAGTYLVTVSKQGYVTQTATIYVNAGELTSVTMALQAV